MMKGHAITLESGRKLSKLLWKDKNQPPPVGDEDILESFDLVTYAFPPSTGIPPAVYNATTKTLTTGVAMCKLAVSVSPGVYTEGATSVLVENQVGTAVATNGKPITIAPTSFGRWEIIVEDCTAGSTGGGSNPNTNPDNPVPVPSPDPINEGTSKSFSLGYILGV